MVPWRADAGFEDQTGKDKADWRVGWRRRWWRRFPALALAFSLGAPAAAGAATVTTYNDRSTWESALPAGVIFLEDFNDFDLDSPFRSSPVDAGAFSLAQVGVDASSSSFNLVDAPDAGGNNAFFDFFNLDGTSYALTRVEADQGIDVDVTFDNPVLAWGGDLGAMVGSENLDLELFFDGGGSTLEQLLLGDFLGFISDMPVNQVTLLARQSNGDIGNGMNFGLDNTKGVLVPEPTTLLLVSAGLTGLASSRRRLRH